ncbi:MAG: branched-chain amino acid transport system II carrier protein [Spirochaetia bacterium]|jgi:LIVCS family branched-chain amino acid:cation transporter|nr:branched-chain amino acid transport system II carrier protein [Spirochaetia bacterium]
MGESTKRYLPLATLLVISGAMFAGHFGVGDVIFPSVLGRDAGAAWFPAALGYFIMNSIGVWLAYMGVARQDKTMAGISREVLGKTIGGIYVIIPVLIQILFILPRVSSATHEMAIASFFPGIPLWLTLLVYFLLNFYLASSRSKVVDRLGKLLSPALILFIVILLIKGVLAPNGQVAAEGMKNAIGGGLLNGYNTMNALAAFLLGGWILNELKLRKVEDKPSQTANLIRLGLFTAIALGVTSTGLVYLGASTGTLFPNAEIGVLSVEIAGSLLGVIGKAIFGVLIALACITTSASITSMAGDMFTEVSGGRIKYLWVTIAASVAGFAMGLVGLSRIVRFTVPWLLLVYPSVIVLIITSQSSKFQQFRITIAAGVATSVFFSIGDFLGAMGFPGNPVGALVAKLPLGSISFGWLLPTLIVMLVVLFVSGEVKKLSASNTPSK